MKKCFFSICFLVFYLFSVSIPAQEKKPSKIEFPLKEIQSRRAKSGLVVSDIQDTSTESGGTASFTIHLSSKPFDTVEAHIASKNKKEGVVEPKNITFTPENWLKPQKVKITGQDDLIMDGNQTYTIEISVSSERDFDYSRTPLKRISLKNIDNDQAGFFIGKISDPTTEDGGSAFFKIRLNSQPTHTVTIPVTSSDITEGKLKSKKLHFTKENWNWFQLISVIGQNDFVMDGKIKYRIVFKSAISDDTRYNGLTPRSINVINLDNDTAAIITSGIKGNTNENNENVNFSVSLKSEPTARVVIRITSTNTNEGTVKPNVLAFTPKNWKKQQNVRVFGVNDSVDDENQKYEIVLSPSGSKDTVYGALHPVRLKTINEDDNTAEILIRIVANQTSEFGEKGKFFIKLNSKPTADVRLRLESDTPAEGQILLKKYIFTSGDWYQEKAVTVVGINDNQADGDKAYSIIIHPAVSQDLKYNQIDPKDVELTNLDDENVGVAFGQISGQTTEKNGSASFTARLNSKPSADVTIHFSSSNKKEGVVDTPKLVFNPGYWNQFQTVSVTGQMDGIVDGNQPYTVISKITSQDMAFAAYIPEPVSVINTDTNNYAVIIDQETGDTSESGKAVSLAFKLNSKPDNDVAISLNSSDSTEGLPKPQRLMFTSANWNHQQMVSVVGVNDDVKDGNQPYRLEAEVNSPGDPNYQNIKVPDIFLRNLDNDTVGITVRQISDITTEENGTAEFSIKLNSEPTSSVVFIFSCDDESEGNMIDSHAAFFKDNWNKKQIIKVKGAPDNLVDGDRIFHIVSEGAISKDPEYNNMPFKKLRIVNRDLDKPGFIIGKIDGNTSESGRQAQFTVRLNSIPKADVDIEFFSDNQNEGRVTPKQLVFTSDNWNKEQAVTITGSDDDFKDGDQDYHIVFSPSESQDSNYHKQQLQPVKVINEDNMSMSAGLIMSNFSLTDSLKEEINDFSGIGIIGGYVINRKLELFLSFVQASGTKSQTIYKYNVNNPMEYKFDLKAISCVVRYIYLRQLFDVYFNAGFDLYLWQLESLNRLNDSVSRNEGESIGVNIGIGANIALLDLVITGIEANYHIVSRGFGNSQISMMITYPF